MVFAAIVLAANLAWAEGLVLGETKEQLKWYYHAIPLAKYITRGPVTLRPAASAGQPPQPAGPAAVKPEADAGPAPPASAERHKDGKTSTGGTLTVTSTATVSGSAAAADDIDIALPFYRLRLLMQPLVLKELNLAAEQKQKLRAIAKKYYADQQKFYEEAINVKKLSEDKLAPARAQWYRREHKEIEGEVEKTLTCGQVQSLRELTFRELVSQRVWEPKLLGNLGLSKEQKERILALDQEMGGWYRKADEASIDTMLSVLNPQQRARLREEALGPLGPQDHLSSIHIQREAALVRVYSLWPYPDFTEPRVRKEFGLSATQEQQVREILGGSERLADGLAREVEKLPHQERKKLLTDALKGTVFASGIGGGASPEQVAKFWDDLVRERRKQRAGFAEQPMMKPSIALRRRFEAVLTPKQIALYHDLAFRNFAAAAIMDAVLLRMIGASEGQAAELERASRDLGGKTLQFQREMGGKLLGVLTPAQQEALRADVEAEVRRIESLSGEGPLTKTGTGTLILNDAEPTGHREVAVTNTVPLELGSSIPLAVQSPGVAWKGNTYHLVNLGSVRFDLDQSDCLKADIQAGLTSFDNVDYDISGAVFDAAGQMLGSARAQCKVERLWLGGVKRTGRTIRLDFGVSLDYRRAAAFVVSVSNRKVLTPDDWQK
jgi:hypothetical protein